MKIKFGSKMAPKEKCKVVVPMTIDEALKVKNPVGYGYESKDRRFYPWELKQLS